MEYKVVKEYAGIKIGNVVKSNKANISKYMVDKGYWEKVIEPEYIKKIDPKLDGRKKKVMGLAKNK